MADDFRINIESQVDLSKAKSDLDKFLSSYKKDKLKIDVEFSGLKNNDIVKQFESVGSKAGKSFSTALQKQIESIAKTQKTYFSETLKTMTKREMSYSDWFNKELNKPSNKNYGKNQQILAIETYLEDVEKQAKKAEQIKKRISQGFADVETSSIKKSLNKYKSSDSTYLKDAEESYKRLISLKKELSSGISDDKFKRTLSDKDIIKKAEQYVQVLEKCKNQIKTLSNESTSISKPFDKLDAIAAGNKTLSWLNENTKATKEYGEALKELARLQKNATNRDDLSDYNKQVKALISDAKSKGLTGKSTLDDIGRAFKQIGQFAYTYGTIQNVQDLIIESISDLKDMNSILTEISKTSDLTTSQLKELGETSFDSASKFGKTAKDYLLGIQEMSRSGFYGKKAEGLAELSILGQAAGDMDANLSNSYILATNAAYGYAGSVEKLSGVLDGQNMINIMVMLYRNI